jgi:hypothetical protein
VVGRGHFPSCLRAVGRLGTRIVNAVEIDHARLDESAKLNQMMLIAAIAGEAGRVCRRGASTSSPPDSVADLEAAQGLARPLGHESDADQPIDAKALAGGAAPEGVYLVASRASRSRSNRRCNPDVRR